MTTQPINNSPIPCMPHAAAEHVPTTPENSNHALARLLGLKTEKTYEKEAQRMQREPRWQPPATPPHTSVFFKNEGQIDEYRSWVGDDGHIPYQIVSHEAALFERRRDWIDWDISSMYATVRKERAARRGGKNGGFRLVD